MASTQQLEPNVGGRPTLFHEHLIQEVFNLAKQGLTNLQMAERLGISLSTLKLWRKKHEGFSTAIEAGKEIADETIEFAMYQRAAGYSHADVHITNYKGKVTVTKIVKHYPPDVSAAKFWLTNRRPDRWKNKVEVADLGSIVGALVKKNYDLGVGDERGAGDTGQRDSERAGPAGAGSEKAGS